MNAKGSDNSRGILRTIPQEREYPDPQTLPIQPSWQQSRPQLTLSELAPGKYVSTTARIVFLKTIERQDAFGNKLMFSGILEDSTFKVPFVTHRISYPLLRNSVYKFYSAYVHEFDDKSVLLVITEHTKIEPKNIEDYRLVSTQIHLLRKIGRKDQTYDEIIKELIQERRENGLDSLYARIGTPQ